MVWKGIGAKAWRLLLDMVRDAWVKGTAQGERGEVWHHRLDRQPGLFAA
ncbi:MAG: hypothetical protein KGR26_15430 [Cyanobacteria bacterium REEB65]|nr:hypothetical protein [Cyanobacteria bacterium REEB65]